MSIVFTFLATGTDGRIHRGIRVHDELFTAERDNLDQADRTEIDADEAARRADAGDPLCERCFPDGTLDEVEVTELSNTADPGRAGEL